MLKKVFRVFELLLWVIVACAVLCGFVFAVKRACGIKHPTVFNRYVAIVESDSMEPTIPTMSLIVGKKSDSLSIGDIVTFEDYRGLSITHRIVDKDNGYLLTKGDANSKEDLPFSEEHVIGKVVGIYPRLGELVSFFRRPVVVCVNIGLIFIMLLVRRRKRYVM